MAPSNNDNIIAAIARLEAEMQHMREDVIELKKTVETLSKARWVGSGFLLALGGGAVYGVQKLAVILPALGR